MNKKFLGKIDFATILVLVIIVFLGFNLIRASLSIQELRAENLELLEYIDRYSADADENF